VVASGNETMCQVDSKTMNNIGVLSLNPQQRGTPMFDICWLLYNITHFGSGEISTLIQCSLACIVWGHGTRALRFVNTIWCEAPQHDVELVIANSIVRFMPRLPSRHQCTAPFTNHWLQHVACAMKTGHA
jgi:hypothetical protein